MPLFYSYSFIIIMKYVRFKSHIVIIAFYISIHSIKWMEYMN